MAAWVRQLMLEFKSCKEGLTYEAEGCGNPDDSYALRPLRVVVDGIASGPRKRGAFRYRGRCPTTPHSARELLR